MTQRIINIGTAPNDGTGDTLRQSFANTNNNFTELYSNLANVNAFDIVIYTNANAAFDKANSANVLAFNTGIGANAWSNAVGIAGNNYTKFVGAAGNNYTNAVGIAGNNYTNSVGQTGYNYTDLVGAAGNNYTNSVGVAGNNYTDLVGAAGNNYTIDVGTSCNSYANGIVTASFDKANLAWNYANTVNTYVTIRGPYDDDSAATSNGVQLMGLYYTAQGNVKIRLV
jgi:hypothetical protein